MALTGDQPAAVGNGQESWGGELTPPEIMRLSLQHTARPVVTLGRPELWPAGKALETEVGKKWMSPLGRGLQRVLEGLRGEEATAGLPEDVAEIVRAVLKSVTG